jgi:hypothetical protein
MFPTPVSREAGNKCMCSSSTTVLAPFILMSGDCFSVLSGEAAAHSESWNFVTAVRNSLSGTSKADRKISDGLHIYLPGTLKMKVKTSFSTTQLNFLCLVVLVLLFRQ